MWRRLFQSRDDHRHALYAAVVAQARHPAFYTAGGVADTIDGRFDLVLLHLALAIDRLREADRSIAPAGQALFERFVADMDATLRESGVGDLAVPKRMKRIGEAFYGRFDAYTRARDQARLAAAIGRNVYAGSAARAGDAAALARYYLDARKALAAQPAEEIAEGRIAWPAPLLDKRNASDDELSDQPA